MAFQPADQREADILSKLHPIFRTRVEDMLMKCRQASMPVYIFEGLRTVERQKELYSKGRDSSGKVIDKSKVVTNAKPGTSYHNYGVAVDIVFDGDTVKPGIQWTWNAPTESWKKLGAVGQSCGLEWAGSWLSFPEFPHFQLSVPALKWQGMLALYTVGGLQRVWQEIDKQMVKQPV